MRTGMAIVFGFGLCVAIVACGDDTADQPALDPVGSVRSTVDRPTDHSATSITGASLKQSTVPSSVATSIPGAVPAPSSTFYNPPVLAEGDTVVAEIRSLDDPSLDPSLVQFRLVEFEDGPFLETSITDLAAGADAALWNLRIDGRLRAKFSSPSGRHGTRISPEQYSNGVTVALSGTNEAEAASSRLRRSRSRHHDRIHQVRAHEPIERPILPVVRRTPPTSASHRRSTTRDDDR